MWWRRFFCSFIPVKANYSIMKTRKSAHKTPHKTTDSKNRKMHGSKAIHDSEFAPEEHLAEHFTTDDDFKPLRKSKGADEEG
jgi:hypothetical protein